MTHASVYREQAPKTRPDKNSAELDQLTIARLVNPYTHFKDNTLPKQEQIDESTDYFNFTRSTGRYW